MKRRRKTIIGASIAFTLVELLVVIAIIALLMALIMPVLRTARENARRIQCASNLRQIGLCFRMYQDDHAGTYPDPWVDNSNNWQSYLGVPALGGRYLPSDWVKYDTPSTAYRIVGRFLCPTICRTYNIPIDTAHIEWGYCINANRIEISYGAAGWPWFLSQYQGANLDVLYRTHSKYAVMTDGNNASWNSDNDYSAFTTADPTDWRVQAIHNEMVNTLFMDAHIEPLKVATAAQQLYFNRAWYGGIPIFGGANPYAND